MWCIYIVCRRLGWIGMERKRCALFKKKVKWSYCCYRCRCRCHCHYQAIVVHLLSFALFVSSISSSKSFAPFAMLQAKNVTNTDSKVCAKRKRTSWNRKRMKIPNYYLCVCYLTMELHWQAMRRAFMAICLQNFPTTTANAKAKTSHHLSRTMEFAHREIGVSGERESHAHAHAHMIKSGKGANEFQNQITNTSQMTFRATQLPIYFECSSTIFILYNSKISKYFRDCILLKYFHLTNGGAMLAPTRVQLFHIFLLFQKIANFLINVHVLIARKRIVWLNLSSNHSFIRLFSWSIARTLLIICRLWIMIQTTISNANLVTMISKLSWNDELFIKLAKNHRHVLSSISDTVENGEL